MAWSPLPNSQQVVNVLKNGGHIPLAGTLQDLLLSIGLSHLNQLSPQSLTNLSMNNLECAPCGNIEAVAALVLVYGKNDWETFIIRVYLRGGKILYGFNGSIATATITIP